LSKVNPQHASKAKKIVRERFPEMSGTEPTVSTRQARSKGAKSRGTLYVFTFKKGIYLPGGGHMTRVVRVTMDQAGKVTKVTSSK